MVKLEDSAARCWLSIDGFAVVVKSTLTRMYTVTRKKESILNIRIFYPIFALTFLLRLERENSIKSSVR